MPIPRKLPNCSLFISFHDTYRHLSIDGQQLTLSNLQGPLYKKAESAILAQGAIAGDNSLHWVVLNQDGHLNYSLYSSTGTLQTTSIGKLDMRFTKYSRMILLLSGKTIHIFYAFSHQSTPDLWRIVHRFWDGKKWASIHMGEVVHPKEPLYTVNMDNQGNLHFLSMTFQGRHSLLFSNRFNGAFHIWGNLNEAMKIDGEVIDMNSVLTSDNQHYLFWITRTIDKQYELHWLERPQANEISSKWPSSSAMIKTFKGWKKLGTIEINNQLFLLAHADQIYLLQYKEGNWITLQTADYSKPLLWTHRHHNTYHHTYWIESPENPCVPIFYKELGLALPNLNSGNDTPSMGFAPFSQPKAAASTILTDSGPKFGNNLAQILESYLLKAKPDHSLAAVNDQKAEDKEEKHAEQIQNANEFKEKKTEPVLSQAASELNIQNSDLSQSETGLNTQERDTALDLYIAQLNALRESLNSQISKTDEKLQELFEFKEKMMEFKEEINAFISQENNKRDEQLQAMHSAISHLKQNNDEINYTLKIILEKLHNTETAIYSLKKKNLWHRWFNNES